MNKFEKAREVEHIKSEVNTPKSRLIEYMQELEEIGAIREAKSLGTIIWKLEMWQHK